MKITHLSPSICIQSSSVRALALAQKMRNHSVNIICYRDERTELDKGSWRELNTAVCAARQFAGIHFGDSVYKALGAQNPNVTHVHGLWLRLSAHNHRWTRDNKVPYLVAPRGALEASALRDSSWKKKLALSWFENASLRDSACLHALSEHEAVSLRKFGLKNPIAIIPDGINLPSPYNKPTPPPWARMPQANGKKILLFIGRIHPQKGLSLLVDALAQVKKKRPQALEQWHTVIAGYNQDNHQEQLQAKVREQGLEAQVSFVGPVIGESKNSALCNAAAFTMPACSEGIPMALLEAWSYGLPSVINAECSLPADLSEGASLKAQANADSFTEALLTLFAMEQSQLQAMSNKAVDLVKARFSWDKIAMQTVDVYKWLRKEGEAPACVTAHGI